jgi:GDP-L-fucose synthase
MPASKIFELTGKRIYVAGHRGMVGSATIRALRRRGLQTITADRQSLDLREQSAVQKFLEGQRPDVVVVAAAKVGGILANSSYPAEFLYDNLMIASNLTAAAAKTGVKKLIYLGSTCIYPRLAEQPINEEALLTGPLEPTNEAYAIAKIAGIKLAQAFRVEHGCDFISAMPTNLYGPEDNFDLSSSHVLPALMRKIHEAKVNGERSVPIWGSGTPRREFLHVDDLADAILFLLEHYSDLQFLNVGTGTDVTIRELAEQLAEVVGYTGSFTFDRTKPDGTPRKCTDITRLRALGWSPRISLTDGITSTYQWFLDQHGQVRGAA